MEKFLMVILGITLSGTAVRAEYIGMKTGVGALSAAGTWVGDVLPSGSSTGLVTETVNVWAGNSLRNQNIRQTGGSVQVAGSGNLGLKEGAFYEIDDRRPEYAAYTNLTVGGKLVLWSDASAAMELRLLSGSVEVHELALIEGRDQAVVSVCDGVLHVGTLVSGKGTFRMLAGGSGDIQIDRLDAPGLYVEFEPGSRGRIALGEKADGQPARGVWQWLIKNGQVSIDGRVCTDASRFLVRDHKDGSTLSLSNEDTLISAEPVRGVPGSCGTLLHQSDFSSGAPGWTVPAGGQWTVHDGVFEGVDRAASVGDSRWERYRMTCRARTVDGGEDGQIWVSFCCQDEWNRYAVAIRDGELNDVYLLRYREVPPPEPDVQIGLSRPLGFEPEEGEWMAVRVDVEKGRIRVWVGDVESPQIDYQDASPLVSGGIALGGNYHRCQFDDVRVERILPTDRFSTQARKFNFGPADTPAVQGYELSDGSVFDAALGYGWDQDLRTLTRRRGVSESPVLDNLQAIAHSVTNAVFSVTVPNGEYYVTAVVYDGQYGSRFEAFVEEDAAMERRDLRAGETFFAGRRASVTDGSLDVTFLHPEGEPGVAVSCLVVEPWDAAKVRVMSEAKKYSDPAAREKRRQLRRAACRPVSVDPSSSLRTVTDLSGNWLFKPQHELPADHSPELPQTDDQGWHVLNVPDFWTQIGWWNMGPSRWGERGQATGFRLQEEARTAAYTFDYAKTKTGWYRQWVDLADRIGRERLHLEFDAVASVASVYVNGVHVGDHLGMFAPFSFDVTPHVRWGEKNLLAVRVSSGALDSASKDKVRAVAITVEVTDSMLNEMPRGMYRGVATTPDGEQIRLTRPAGIWQPVRLVRTAPVEIQDVFFRPRCDGAGIDVTLYNAGDAAFSGRLEAEVAGVIKTVDVRVDSGGEAKLTLDLNMNEPDLWSPDDPNLYPLHLRLCAQDRTVDEYSEQVGFRTVELRDGSFLLNGKPYWFGGANMPPTGLKPNDGALASRFLKQMHDGNLRITRSHGNPFTKPWADAADREGVAVSLEGTWPWLMINDSPIPDEALLEIWRAEMRDLVRSLRNHPGIVMWTVGNEMHPGRGVEGSEQWLKKWTILSDMIKEIRKLDPTRPVCAFSGYERDAELYEKFMKPNGLDDGDFTDPHQYHGWYEPSIRAHSVYNGTYLHGVEKAQAILSQEAATGYPNDDTGNPERMYIQLYVPQVWVGDDAYEHRSPGPFLAHQALVTKEWVEDVRRTRSTAGWMAFNNSCWFQNVCDVEKSKPYPVCEAAKVAFQDVLVSLDQRNRHCFLEDTVSGKIVAVHDDPAIDVLQNLECDVSVETSSGTVLGKQKIKLGDCNYFANTSAGFSVPLNRTLPAARDRAFLRLRMLSKGSLVSENQYQLTVARRDWALAPFAAPVEVCLLNGAESIRNALLQMKCRIVETLPVSDKTAVVWSGGDLPAAASEMGAMMLDHVEHGGTLVLLETGEAETLVQDPAILSSKIWYGEGKPYNNRSPHHEFMNMEIPSHRLFDGLEPHDIKWWNGLRSDRHPDSPYVCEGSYELAKGAPNIVRLGEVIPQHSYAWVGPKRCPVFVMKKGCGRILVSELRTSACVSDPLAARFLRNAIDWAAHPDVEPDFSMPGK